MTQSKECADVNQQPWNLQGDTIYPQIGLNMLNHASALQFLDLDLIDSTHCLWSLPILEFSDGPNFSGFKKFGQTFQDTLYSIFKWIGAHGGYSDRTQWKDSNGRDYQVWDYVRISEEFCPPFTTHTYDHSLEGFNGWANANGDDGSDDGFVRDTLGWGMIAADDQILSDVFGAISLVPAAQTQATDALAGVKKLACSNQISDTEADLRKSIVDLVINIDAAWITPGYGSFLVNLALIVSHPWSLRPYSAIIYSTMNFFSVISEHLGANLISSAELDYIHFPNPCRCCMASACSGQRPI